MQCANLLPQHAFEISRDDVASMFKNVKVNKATGPDKITGKLIKTCHLQLCSVFHVLFQLCVEMGEIPLLWKTTEIVPISKKPNPVLLSDYRPIALTSLLMKSFERIVLTYMLPQVEHLLICHACTQFPYQPLTVCECQWRMFVTYVYLHRSSYGVCTVAIFVGCVLSPFVYTMYTNSCRSAYSSNHYFKYADDTALVGLLSDDETDYRSDIDHFVSWFVANCLELNVVKTKELVIDFRSGVHHPTPVNINWQT